MVIVSCILPTQGLVSSGNYSNFGACLLEGEHFPRPASSFGRQSCHEQKQAEFVACYNLVFPSLAGAEAHCHHDSVASLLLTWKQFDVNASAAFSGLLFAACVLQSIPEAIYTADSCIPSNIPSLLSLLSNLQ